MARKMRKMARKMEKNGNGSKMGFRAIFPFSGPCFSHFFRQAKIHLSAIFVPISGRRPERDLYQVHGIPTHDHRCSPPAQSLLSSPGVAYNLGWLCVPAATLCTSAFAKRGACKKGVFARFRGKWGSAPQGPGVGGGGPEAPFTAKTSPFFGENAFKRA